MKLHVCYNEKNNAATLTVNDKVYKCNIGKKGVINSQYKVEGDCKTPTGTYKILEAYYREDRLPKHIVEQINTPKKIIQEGSVWADDPNYPDTYNTYREKNDYPNGQPPFSVESLMREDNLYDLLYEINHNADRTPGLGSAIFLHIGEKPTAGCIALNEQDLFELVPQITTDTEISVDIIGYQAMV
ncbi:L,D-transpeptidase family protein [Candidatus Tisiphia endosymbiont of Oplodontha viridula]|uniref:L,D-transpeptidase family protein n=1 Tax=Candidatus Tisiphia endosymbiont of Oplodontha viridula TaxID=3077925 RepID=UPI0035C93FF3